MIDNDKKAVIHIAKTQTGMTEIEYRDLLSSVGAKSSKDLDNKTFGHVMSRFEALGYKSKSKTKVGRKIHNLPPDKQAVMKKIEAILLDMDLNWAYVDSMAKKRFGVDAAQWLEGGPLFKLLQMMIYHHNRWKKKAIKEECH